MLAAAILSWALAAAPPSILIVPATPSSRPVCEELLETFAAQKMLVKLAGEKAEAVTCTSKKLPADRTACLVDSLTIAKVDAIVLVTATFKAGKGAVTFQLLARTGERERQEVVRGARAKIATLSRPAIGRILGTLRSVLLIEEMHAIDTPAPPKPAPQEPATQEPTGPSDAPRTLEFNLTPDERPRPAGAEAVRAAVEPPRNNRAGAIAVTSVAVAAAGVGGVFAGLGFANKNRLATTTDGVSALSYSQANSLKDQTNTQLTIALSAGITAAVAGAVAGVLWAQ